MYLTSLMGVAYSLGLSKNKSYSDWDAVIPVMKVLLFHLGYPYPIKLTGAHLALCCAW